MRVKVGFGYDIHRLKKGRKLYLGGVEIPHSHGLLGHSDGDALIHAVIDALLGAQGEGDIGRLFPDTDAEFKDIRSTDLLKRIMARLKRKRLDVLNIDAVIVAQAPKLAPYVEKMKETLSSILSIPRDNIGIKAKTNEGLGLIGGGRAIACWAVALGCDKKEKRQKKEAAV